MNLIQTFENFNDQGFEEISPSEFFNTVKDTSKTLKISEKLKNEISKILPMGYYALISERGFLYINKGDGDVKKAYIGKGEKTTQIAEIEDEYYLVNTKLHYSGNYFKCDGKDGLINLINFLYKKK